MIAPAEKLEVLQLLLNTNNEEALKKAKAVLKKYASSDETAYLLSNDANRRHLLDSINELEKGNAKAIKTSDLWK